MNTNKNTNSNRQALSIIGNKSLSHDVTAKNSQEIPSNQNLLFKSTTENQSNLSKNTIIIGTQQGNFANFKQQSTPLELTLKNALKEAIEENEIVFFFIKNLIFHCFYDNIFIVYTLW